MRAGLLGPALVLSLACAIGACSDDPSEPSSFPASSPTSAEPPDLVLIGLDGADWKQIDPLIEAGALPNLAALKARGAWAPLETHTPSLSPALWTTIATGTRRARHGIDGFFEEDAETGKRTPYRSDLRRTRAFWNMLDTRGRSSLVIYWWNTWPAEAIRGAIVSDFLFFSRSALERGGRVDNDTLLAGAVHPPELLPRVLDHLRRAENLDPALVQRIVELPEAELDHFLNRVEHRLGERPNGQILSVLKNKLIESEFHLGLGLDLIAETHHDLYVYYSKGIDAAKHMFFPFYEPGHPAFEGARPRQADIERYRDVIPNFYRYEDANIGRILEAIDDDSYVLLVSDHGHHAAGHDDGPPGVFLLVGPGVQPGPVTGRIALEDIAPLIVHLLDEPVEEGLDGAVPRSVFTRAHRAAHPVRFTDAIPAALPDAAAPTRDLQPELEAELRALGYIE